MKKILMTLVLATALLVSGANESSAASSTYTVKTGDSLYKISTMHKVSVANLMTWNNLNNSLIHPNQKLNVIGGTAPVKSTGTSTPSGSSTYTVKTGDSLYKISTMHKVSVANLKTWNNLNNNLIYPNQKLNVVGGTAPVNNAGTNTPSRSSSDNVVKEFTVSASAYTANCSGCSGITKTGINLKQNPGLKVIAVDPKVIKLGTRVHVEGYGYAVAGDIGGAIKGNKIDVFIPNKSDAFKWGRQDVKIKILN